MTTTDSTTLARPATRSLAIVPLRVFLGATFVDAGLGKLLSAAYLGTGPRGFAAQARGFARGSPIGWLVRAVALPHPMAAGLLLAVAELAIGLLTLVGLASRAAAAGGLALSFTFFLTASWPCRWTACSRSAPTPAGRAAAPAPSAAPAAGSSARSPRAQPARWPSTRAAGRCSSVARSPLSR